MMSNLSSGGTAQPTIVKIKHLSAVRPDRNNCFVWKLHILSNLRGYELTEFVESNITASDPSLVRQDQLLLAWLFTAVSTPLLPLIASSHTSYEAWNILGGIFNTRSRSRIIQLQNQLRSLNRHNEQRFPARVTRPKGKFRNNNSKDVSASGNAIWYPDSGASDHVTSDQSAIQHSDCAAPSKSLTIANGQTGR